MKKKKRISPPELCAKPAVKATKGRIRTVKDIKYGIYAVQAKTEAAGIAAHPLILQK